VLVEGGDQRLGAECRNAPLRREGAPADSL